MKRPRSLVLVVAGVGAIAAAVLTRAGLSRSESKYIGETEKDLDQAFDAVEEQDVVLLVDESADLFDRDHDAEDDDHG